MRLQDELGDPLAHGAVAANELFRDLDTDSRKTFTAIERLTSIPPSLIVFATGDVPVSVYVHLSGSALLIPHSGPQCTINPCLVCPDRIYGLVEALSGHAFESSLQTLTACRFGMIDQSEFLVFLRHQPALCFKLAEIFGESYRKLLQRIILN
jgi:CRP-like cAMP-binding protein